VIAAGHCDATVSGAGQSELALVASALTHNPNPRNVAICRLPPLASANRSTGFDWQCLRLTLADPEADPAFGTQSRGNTV
jgi:hypothetical protein